MKKLLIFFSLFAICFAQKDVIKINYPNKNAKIISVNKPIYITGIINNTYVKELFANGKPVKIDKDGGFVIYDMPKILQEKDANNYYKAIYEFNIIKNDGEEIKYEHPIFIKYPKISWSDEKVQIENIIEPTGDVVIRKNDEFTLKFRATPNIDFWIEIDGIDKKFNVSRADFIDKHYWADIVFGEGFGTNKDTIDGLYFAKLKINNELDKANIHICYKNEQIIERYTIKFKLTVIDKSNLFVIKTLKDKNDNPIIFRNAPGGGYKLFLLPNTKLNVIGKIGGWYKCELNDNLIGYVSESNSEILKNFDVFLPIHLNHIRLEEDNDFIYLKTDTPECLPYEVITFDNSVTIRLFNTINNIDFIRDLTYPSKLNYIVHSQEQNKITTINFRLKQKALWGYSVNFVDNVMIFKFRKPPTIEKGKIKNCIISIDPGHAPDPGAVGIYGLAEKEINLILSNQLKKMLEEKNIKVFITRTEIDKGPELRERKKIVNYFNPHISISIHNNAVPENVNPILNNGSSVYYYFNHSRKFAELIHSNFMKNLNLNNFGLFWDNLYMCRIPESVSVLVEPAFIMLPEQERLLRDKNFQNKIVKSIYDAIISYIMENAQ